MLYHTKHLFETLVFLSECLIKTWLLVVPLFSCPFGGAHYF